MFETHLNKVNIKNLHQMRQGIHCSNNFEHYFNGCEDICFKQVHDGTGQGIHPRLLSVKEVSNIGKYDPLNDFCVSNEEGQYKKLL